MDIACAPTLPSCLPISLTLWPRTFVPLLAAFTRGATYVVTYPLCRHIQCVGTLFSMPSDKKMLAGSLHFHLLHCHSLPSGLPRLRATTPPPLLRRQLRHAHAVCAFCCRAIRFVTPLPPLRVRLYRRAITWQRQRIFGLRRSIGTTISPSARLYLKPHSTYLR